MKMQTVALLAEGRGHRLDLGLGVLDGDPVAVVDGDAEESAVPVWSAVPEAPGVILI